MTLMSVIELLSWGDRGWGDELIRGIAITCQLALVSYLLGLVIGLLGAIARLSRYRALKAIARIYGLVFCSLPELLIITIIFFGGSQFVRWLLSPFGFRGYIEFDAFISGVIALGLISGAYAIDVIRGAIQGVPAGQWEAARALGFSQRALFPVVILPQAMRLAISGLDNLWVANLQGTALVSVLGLNDVVQVAATAGASSQRSTLFFGIVAIAYLSLKALSEYAIKHIRRWADRGVAAEKPTQAQIHQEIARHA